MSDERVITAAEDIEETWEEEVRGDLTMLVGALVVAALYVVVLALLIGVRL